MFSEPQIWHRKKSRGGSHRAKCQLSALHYVRDVDHVDQCVVPNTTSTCRWRDLSKMGPVAPLSARSQSFRLFWRNFHFRTLRVRVCDRTFLPTFRNGPAILVTHRTSSYLLRIPQISKSYHHHTARWEVGGLKVRAVTPFIILIVMSLFIDAQGRHRGKPSTTTAAVKGTVDR